MLHNVILPIILWDKPLKQIKVKINHKFSLKSLVSIDLNYNL